MYVCLSISQPFFTDLFQAEMIPGPCFCYSEEPEQTLQNIEANYNHIGLIFKMMKSLHWSVHGTTGHLGQSAGIILLCICNGFMIYIFCLSYESHPRWR